jgi:chromosome segregation ATPase
VSDELRASLKQWQDNWKDANDKCVQLRARVAELEADNHRLDAANANAHDQMEGLLKEIDALKERAVELEDSVSDALGGRLHSEDKKALMIDSLLDMIGDISTALGISEEEQSCSNGATEILLAIDELKSTKLGNEDDLLVQIQVYGDCLYRAGLAHGERSMSDFADCKKEADESLDIIRAMIDAAQEGK